MTDRKSPRSWMILAGALALGAASPAAAQGTTQPSRPGERVRDAIGKRPGQPAPAPAPAPPTKSPGDRATAAAGQPAQPGQQALTDDQKRIFGTLSLRDAHAVELGQLGEQRAANPQVKALAARIVRDHMQRKQGIETVLQHRSGGDLAALPMPDDKRSPHQQNVQRLQGLSGREFDREFVLIVRELQREDVEDLKQMRDRTSGKDVGLKEWLDSNENYAEERLTEARQAKQSVDAQRAAQR